MMRHLVPALIVAAGLTLLGGGFQGLFAAEADQPATVAEKIAPATDDSVVAEPAPEKYVYDPAGKRDPFQSLMEIRKPVTRPNEPQTPLQKFDLSQLRMVGAIVGMSSPRAMVVAPDGKSYILKIGTKVGKNNGVVVKILKDQVQVKESFYDFTGEVRTSTQTIELPKREGV